MPLPHSEREQDFWDDILMNARAAADFTQGMTFEDFVADTRTNYAVVRCLEIVSEASRRLSPATRERLPGVPWRDIADAGNVYRHGYHRVLLDIVWQTVHERLPDLVAVAQAEIARSPEP